MRLAQIVIAAGVLGLCVIAVWWWAIGGKWQTVRNPSMGSAAPAGTLLWVKPTDINSITVGDIVTFHTPTTVGQSATGGTSQPITVPSQTYTHRVAGRFPDGTLQTKGDLDSAPDPWHINQQHLVGRVTGRWWAAGWLIRALPLLLLGGMAWWMLTSSLKLQRSRRPLRVLGLAVLVAGAVYLYTPLFGATRVSFDPVGPHRAKASYVGTGLMPVKLQANGAPSVVVHSGEERSITVPRNEAGTGQVKVVPTVPWQTWPVVAGAFVILVLWAMIIGAEAPPSRRRRRRRQRRPRPAQQAPQLQTS